MCVKYYVSMYLHTYYIYISNFMSYRENTHSFLKSPVVIYKWIYLLKKF